MKKILCSLLFIAITINANDNLPYKVATKKATHVAHQFHKMMKKSVSSSLKQGGIIKAADFCINHSENIIKTFNKKLDDGISIKRISLKNRNTKAYPNKEEIKILKAFNLLEKSAVYLPSITQASMQDNTFNVYFPATMSQRSCKKCHGIKQNLNSKVIKMLEKKYPNDKAFGYVAGEVRGAVVVTVKLK